MYVCVLFLGMNWVFIEVCLLGICDCIKLCVMFAFLEKNVNWVSEMLIFGFVFEVEYDGFIYLFLKF